MMASPGDPTSELLRDLYVGREWSATQIAAELDTTIQQVLRTCTNTASRSADPGTPQRDSDHVLQRLAALYRDRRRRTLQRHRIPERPMPGTITERFPTPAPITGRSSPRRIPRSG